MGWKFGHAKCWGLKRFTMIVRLVARRETQQARAPSPTLCAWCAAALKQKPVSSADSEIVPASPEISMPFVSQPFATWPVTMCIIWSKKMTTACVFSMLSHN